MWLHSTVAVHWSCKPGVPSSILGVALFFGNQKIFFFGSSPSKLTASRRFRDDAMQMSYFMEPLLFSFLTIAFLSITVDTVTVTTLFNSLRCSSAVAFTYVALLKGNRFDSNTICIFHYVFSGDIN